MVVAPHRFTRAGHALAVWCKYSNALLRLWILGEVEMIGAKTHPEFVDLAVRQVARGMKGVVLKGAGGSRKRSESKIHCMV